MVAQDEDDEAKSFLLLWMGFWKGMIGVTNSQSYFHQTTKMVKSIFLSMSNYLSCILFLKYTMRGIKNHMIIQFFCKSINGNKIGGKLRYV